MFIEQAYTKHFDILKYLPLPIILFVIMLLNFIVVMLLPDTMSVESVIQQQIASKGENRVFFETLLPLAIFLIILWLWVKFIHKQSLRSLTTARSKVSWKRIFFAFGVWAVITSVLLAISYFSERENYEFNFKPVPFAILAVISIIMIPMQTSFEEYFFRGYLMQGIGVATKSRLLPLIFTSVLFGLMHIANPEIEKLGYILLVYYIATGFFLGIITLMDDGLELALGFHAANNLFTALLITSDWSALQTPSIFKDKSIPSAGFDVLLPVFIIYPLLLLLFAKIYKWSGWKEKLTGKITLHQPN